MAQKVKVVVSTRTMTKKNGKAKGTMVRKPKFAKSRR